MSDGATIEMRNIAVPLIVSLGGMISRVAVHDFFVCLAKEFMNGVETSLRERIADQFRVTSGFSQTKGVFASMFSVRTVKGKKNVEFFFIRTRG